MDKDTTPFTPSKKEVYRISFNESIDLFTNYVETIDKHHNYQKEYALSLEYYLNEMEIRFLLFFKAGLEDKYERDQWLNTHEEILFILSSTFFIKSCRYILGIQSPNEFASNLLEQIFPLIRSLLCKYQFTIDEVQVQNKLPSSFGFFHRNVKGNIRGLLNHIKEMGPSSIIINVLEIKKLYDIIEPLLGGTYGELNSKISGAIFFRMKRKTEIEMIMEDRFNSNADKLKSAVNKVLTSLGEKLAALKLAIDNDDFNKNEKDEKKLSPAEIRSALIKEYENDGSSKNSEKNSPQ